MAPHSSFILPCPSSIRLPIPEGVDVSRATDLGYTIGSVPDFKKFVKFLLPSVSVSHPVIWMVGALDYVLKSQGAAGMTSLDTTRTTTYAMACPEGILRLDLYPEEAFRLYTDTSMPLKKRLMLLKPAQKKRVAALSVEYDTSIDAVVAVARLSHNVVIVGPGRQDVLKRSVAQPILDPYDNNISVTYEGDRSPNEIKQRMLRPRVSNLLSYAMHASSASLEDVSRWANQNADPGLWVVVYAPSRD